MEGGPCTMSYWCQWKERIPDFLIVFHGKCIDIFQVSDKSLICDQHFGFIANTPYLYYNLWEIERPDIDLTLYFKKN